MVSYLENSDTSFCNCFNGSKTDDSLHHHHQYEQFLYTDGFSENQFRTIIIITFHCPEPEPEPKAEAEASVKSIIVFQSQRGMETFYVCKRNACTQRRKPQDKWKRCIDWCARKCGSDPIHQHIRICGCYCYFRGFTPCFQAWSDSVSHATSSSCPLVLRLSNDTYPCSDPISHAGKI